MRRPCALSGPDSANHAAVTGSRRAVPPLPRQTAPCRIPGRCPAGEAGLTYRAELALDDAGPGRQASPSCPPARERTGYQARSSAAPEATAREPCLSAAIGRAWCAPAGRRLR